MDFKQKWFEFLSPTKSGSPLGLFSSTLVGNNDETDNAYKMFGRGAWMV